MGAGVWQCGAEKKKKLGERERASEISLCLLLNFANTSPKKAKRRKSSVSLRDGGGMKKKVGRGCVVSWF